MSDYTAADTRTYISEPLVHADRVIIIVPQWSEEVPHIRRIRLYAVAGVLRELSQQIEQEADALHED